ncbi:hypothetical protein OUZ56_010089 [Daphnia magna]|uniref:Uncharacterized protein n=1 Tax=Daphnia magna TaxID=35525 RepID=A0ABR0AHR5_9CRUS|nr:hypothetical protein OUZ56_010089 [Daphnia magna]
MDTALDTATHDLCKAHTLLSSACHSLSSDTIQAMGLTDAQLNGHAVIIMNLRSRCNANCNRQQGDQQVADWLCELRDLARKCEFATYCCARCEPTRILGKLISGIYSDEVRIKLHEQGTAYRTQGQW